MAELEEHPKVKRRKVTTRQTILIETGVVENSSLEKLKVAFLEEQTKAFDKAVKGAAALKKPDNLLYFSISRNYLVVSSTHLENVANYKQRVKDYILNQQAKEKKKKEAEEQKRKKFIAQGEKLGFKVIPLEQVEEPLGWAND